MRASALFFPLGIAGLVCGQQDFGTPSDLRAILPDNPQASSSLAEEISHAEQVAATAPSNVAAAVESVFDYSSELDNRDVRFHTPPFLCPGPCTDCAPFSKFVGDGHLPTPGHLAKRAFTDTHTVTVTVLDERPGESTLNPPTTSDPSVITETTTVVGITTTVTPGAQPVIIGSDGSIIATLKVTTTHGGNPEYVTGPDGGATSTVHIAAPGLNATKTNYPTTIYTGSSPILSSSSLVSATTVVAGGLPTVYRTVYRTMTVTNLPMPSIPRCGRPTPGLAVATRVVATLDDGSLVNMTGRTSTHGDTIIVLQPTAALYKVDVPKIDRARFANMMTFLLDFGKLTEDMEALRNLSSSDCQRRYAGVLDWPVVSHLATHLRQSRQELDWPTALKLATIYQLRANATEMPPGIEGAMHPPALEDRMLAVDTHTTYRTVRPAITATTTFSTSMTTPIACLKGPQHNKTECKVQRCMQRHQAPINITTAFRAVQYQGSCPFAVNEDNDWFTHATSVVGAHWGTTEAVGVHYPYAASLTVNRHGAHSVVMTNDLPTRSPPPRYGEWAPAPAPKCWDEGTCCQRCNDEVAGAHWYGSFADPWDWGTPIPWLIVLTIVGLLTSMLSCCCCGPLLLSRHRRNRKIDPNAPLSAAIPFIGRPPQEATVVDPATGQVVETVTTTGGAGSGVDPALAAAGGAAAGAALANEKSGGQGTATTTGADTGAGDGRGTMRRQAEEGRGRVAFADPAQTADQGATKVVTVPAQAADDGAHTATTAAPDEHVETVPASHDGAYDGAAGGRPTGSQMADMGSMRGRKKTRQAGHGDMLNIGF